MEYRNIPASSKKNPIVFTMVNPASNLCFHSPNKMHTKCHLNDFYLTF